MTESDKNINADCVTTCKEKEYTVASTRGHNCYCTNSLPLPQLYHANDSSASGNSGPCSMTCPGAWTEENCQGDECCGGENAYSVFIVGGSQQMLQHEAAQLQGEDEVEIPKRFQIADIQSLGKFDGCYSDEKAKVLGGESGLVFNWNDNYNAKCQLMCQEKGYAIASTKGSYCYCTYTLPLPQLYRASNESAAGNGGPCSTVCPGVFTTGNCRGDECCGGVKAASVYIVGSIDALKQLERRVIERVLQSPRAKELVRGSQVLLNPPLYFKRKWEKKSCHQYYTREPSEEYRDIPNLIIPSAYGDCGLRVNRFRVSVLPKSNFYLVPYRFTIKNVHNNRIYNLQVNFRNEFEGPLFLHRGVILIDPRYFDLEVLETNCEKRPYEIIF